MTFLQIFWNSLWIGSHVLQAVLAIAMYRRRLHRQFPFFFSYTVFEAIQFCVIFLLIHIHGTSKAVYFQAFSIGTLGSTCLRFCMLYEILVFVLKDYPALDGLARSLFRWTAVLVLLGAAILAVAVPGNGADRALLVLAVLDRTMSILQCGLLLGLFVFSSYFKLSWRSSIFGIALGLGIFACVELATVAFRAQFAATGRFYLDMLVFAAYLISVLLWMFYLLVPEKVVAPGVSTLPTHDLETWNQELQRLLRQ